MSVSMEAKWKIYTKSLASDKVSDKVSVCVFVLTNQIRAWHDVMVHAGYIVGLSLVKIRELSDHPQVCPE